MKNLATVYSRANYLPNSISFKWFVEPSDQEYLYELVGVKTADEAECIARRVFPDHIIKVAKGYVFSDKAVDYTIQ